jgi:hypothetical protein|tara:strand:- start:683 stop:1120 length:438 start_codon:yes stop_codon:yes gene_type:complete
MAYIGNILTKDFTSTTSVQTLTGDGSTAYSISTSVSNPEHIAVLRNGVRQKPTTDYTVSGSQITFTTALASSDSCFIIFLDSVVGTKTPGTGSITAPMMTSFNGVYENLATITSTVAVASTDNAFLAGPVTFTGTVTVEGNLTVV